MLFSSITFLYFFLPVVLLLYYVSPKPGKNIVLLLSSIFFYGWGEPRYVILMLASCLLGYIFGLLIDKYRGNTISKISMILSVISSVLILGIFKYADFFITNFAEATGISINVLSLALPIGISFYTFQIISYTVDVYKNDAKVQKNFINLATYISFFPQLIAGPIVRYSDIEDKLRNRKHELVNISKGIERFIIGLSKKVLIANQLGEIGTLFHNSGEKSVLFFWLYAVSATLHIYFDFSGYSDMAIGLGKMFGFDFPENFNYPYISRSITEFWRRWHMSLGSWFRDYVYIPLGGNRVSKLKWIRNIVIVWGLTGLWHGAAWNFILWGLMYAVLLLFEKLVVANKIEKLKVVNHIYVMLMVIIGFVIFEAESINDALLTIRAMFGMAGYPAISGEAVYYFKSFGIILLMSIIGATPFTKRIYEKIISNDKAGKIANALELLIMPVLLVLVTAYLVDGSFNPFLYFRF